MKTLRQTAGWLRSHPWIATSFCAGVIAGLLLCLPLLPYEMPDSSASVIGAALGAVFAVWGAAWVADLKESKHRSYLVRAIESTVEPALMYVEQFGVGLEQIIKKGSGVTREERAARIQSSLTESGPVTERLSEMESRLEFLIPLFSSSGGMAPSPMGSCVIPARRCASVCSCSAGEPITTTTNCYGTMQRCLNAIPVARSALRATRSHFCIASLVPNLLAAPWAMGRTDPPQRAGMKCRNVEYVELEMAFGGALQKGVSAANTAFFRLF